VSADGVSAIVLAGGRSSRFGGDKLAALVGGRPLLQRAVEAVAETADEVVVVLAPDAPIPALPSGGRPRILIARDLVAGRGPLAGLAVGLALARHRRALLVAGDQPFLRDSVLRLLLDHLGSADGPGTLDVLGRELDVAVLEDGPRLWPFPVALRVATVRPAAARALEGTDRRLFTLFGTLRVARVPEPRWRALDPAGDSLRDVDTRDELPSA
jgi:molybdopterin-guanine dinucleotide biosynthesis protein A